MDAPNPRIRPASSSQRPSTPFLSQKGRSRSAQHQIRQQSDLRRVGSRPPYAQSSLPSSLVLHPFRLDSSSFPDFRRREREGSSAIQDTASVGLFARLARVVALRQRRRGRIPLQERPAELVAPQRRAEGSLCILLDRQSPTRLDNGPQRRLDEQSPRRSPRSSRRHFLPFVSLAFEVRLRKSDTLSLGFSNLRALPERQSAQQQASTSSKRGDGRRPRSASSQLPLGREWQVDEELRSAGAGAGAANCAGSGSGSERRDLLDARATEPALPVDRARGWRDSTSAFLPFARRICS